MHVALEMAPVPRLGILAQSLPSTQHCAVAANQTSHVHSIQLAKALHLCTQLHAAVTN